MTSVSILLILVGLFIIVNSQNFVGVFQGNKAFSFQGAKNKAVSGTNAGTREQLQKDYSIHHVVTNTGY